VAPLDLGNDLLPLCFVRDVMPEVDRLPARGGQRRGEVVAADIVDVADDDRGALARQVFHAGFADPGGAARYQRDFALYLAHASAPVASGGKA
jgi:hypothetical protein